MTDNYAHPTDCPTTSTVSQNQNDLLPATGQEPNDEASKNDMVSAITLDKILKQGGALHVRRALNIFIRCGEAMEDENTRGNVHGDFSPACIMVLAAETLCQSCARLRKRAWYYRRCKVPGCAMSAERREQGHREEIKLTGYGTEKLLERTVDTRTFTRTADIVGSARYMSPEIGMGQPVDARSDIYSLGCVMYETLCGKPPFAGENQVKTILKQIEEDPVPCIAPFLSYQSNHFSVEAIALQSIISKCLEKDPDMRYQTANDLLSDLKLVERSYMVQAVQKPWSLGSYELRFWCRSPDGGRQISAATFRYPYTFKIKTNAGANALSLALIFSPFVLIPQLFGFSNGIIANLLWMSPALLALSTVVLIIFIRKLIKLSVLNRKQTKPGDRWLQIMYGSVALNVALFGCILLIALLSAPPFYLITFSAISLSAVPAWLTLVTSSVVASPFIILPIWLVRKTGSNENISGW